MYGRVCVASCQPPVSEAPYTCPGVSLGTLGKVGRRLLLRNPRGTAGCGNRTLLRLASLPWTSLPTTDQVQLNPEQLAGHLAALNQPEKGARWADAPDAPPVQFAHLWMVTPHEFIGRVSIRYELTDKLLRSGGHIGYEVRPVYRGRGLGHRALQLGMEHLRARGISSFLLTCRDDNAGSIRIIEAAGGMLENVVDHPNIPGKRNCRYWIGRAL